MTRSGQLPKLSRVLSDRWRDRTLVYRKQPLSKVLRDLGRREILSVLIEGGGEILGQAVDERVIDKVQLYVAPVFGGGPVTAFAGRGASSTVEAMRFKSLEYRKIGPDVRVVGYPAPAAVAAQFANK